MTDLFLWVCEGLTKNILVIEMSKNDQYSKYISYVRGKNSKIEPHILNITEIEKGAQLFLCLRVNDGLRFSTIVILNS